LLSSRSRLYPKFFAGLEAVLPENFVEGDLASRERCAAAGGDD